MIGIALARRSTEERIVARRFRAVVTEILRDALPPADAPAAA